MFPRNAHGVPELLTELALDNYADRLATQRALAENAAAEVTPLSNTWLEEALATLQLIHGKVFTSAVGIALHGAELITRFVACDDTIESNSSKEQDQQQQPSSSKDDLHNGVNNFTGRCLYFVGEHCLLSPYFCPCGAYNYQGMRRQETWLCKHLLALRIALHLERRGLVTDGIRIRKVSTEELQGMLQRLD
ncbi:uncharacterized protein TM35_000081130 [Trypanosoma theileri]|uniref:SWIM-type domain-containing protein n=1 Tax=Trypanosoma theileri TaxID=67003 RepID=A0A1X0P068_9TRYP|nr:uncharacterized protein TM35_000081130 [Trypanosoma theileri]ORC90315.1 hypothetical protein TM35_000081130 [Trypanosoma theileri]